MILIRFDSTGFLHHVHIRFECVQISLKLNVTHSQDSPLLIISLMKFRISSRL